MPCLSETLSHRRRDDRLRRSVLLTKKIDEMVWQALTDTSFRKRLLTERRPEFLADFGLSEEERQFVMAVHADTLENFAGALCRSAA